jgi:hypothetical protein
MSGSFQAPTPAYFESPFCFSRMESIEEYLPLMSPVVRQLLPTEADQVQGSSCPHWHIEKKMCLPEALRASLMTGYLTCDEVPSVLQLSYFR